MVIADLAYEEVSHEYTIRKSKEKKKNIYLNRKRC